MWQRLGKAIGVACVAYVFVANAWNNYSKTWQMARAIQKGTFTPAMPPGFSKDFCIFLPEDIESGLEINNMVALIGLKCTGKSTMLKYCLQRAANPLYVACKSGDVYGSLYSALQDGVRRLPLDDKLRWDQDKSAKQSAEKLVVEIFQRVLRESGKPVVLGLDVFPGAFTDTGEKAETGSRTVAQRGPVNAKSFVADVKMLVADYFVAQAILASSEGMEMMNVQEPRLQKLTAGEMTIDKAQQYIKENYPSEVVSEQLLAKIPRTFDVLKNFGKASDKAAFCEEEMEKITRTIERSALRCKNAKAFYQEAVRPDGVGAKAIVEYCESEENFVRHFVATNIFVQRRTTAYSLQFDCTRVAAKQMFGF